jgi:uncharacterized membrane protein
MTGVFRYLWRRVARFFLAGLLAVLPLVITVAIVVWVADFLERFIGPRTALGQSLSQLGLTISSNAAHTAAYAMGWVVVLGGIFALGVLIELGAKKQIQRAVDALLNRVPLVGSIYGTSKQIVDMLDKKKDEADIKGMSAVFCFFGEDRGAGVLALLVSPDRYHLQGRDYHIVILPTAPVPFGGAMMFVPVESVQPADMSVDGLMSMYVSMGVSAPKLLKP